MHGRKNPGSRYRPGSRLGARAIPRTLKLEVNGQPAAFLDGPGGTQVPQRVIDAMVDYLVNSNANTVGAFLTSVRNDAMLAEAHRAMADLLGCEPGEVFFGQNTTTN